MGKLFIMPSNVFAEASRIAHWSETRSVDIRLARSDRKSVAIDFSAWLSAPQERTANYFPVYSKVSQAMQTALRHWAREWLHQHPAAFERRTAAYSLLVFSCTKPYRGRPTHLFTYDLQQTATLEQAFRTAGRLLSKELERIDVLQRAAGYHGAMSQISRQIQSFVIRNRGPIYQMFHVETALMDEILKFTQMNIPKLGLDRAATELRAGFNRNLRRFSDVADFEERTDDLLRIVTEALHSGFDDGAAMPIAA